MTDWRLWCGLSLATVIAIAVCIRWVDYPMATLMLGNSQPGSPTGRIFSGLNIITAQILVIVALLIVRLWRGGLPKWADTLLIACTASVLAYLVNDTILKAIFGRPNPAAFYQDAHAQKFYLLHGNEYSSFPSGHMMLTSAFLAVVSYFYSRSWIAAVLLMLLGGFVLVQGDWHYVSDVIAGAFLGFAAGLVIARLWNKNSTGRVAWPDP